MPFKKRDSRVSMSLVRSTSAVDINISLLSSDSSKSNKNVSFNLTRNERHYYDSQQSIEETTADQEIDRELEMALESGKVSQSEMMKELLELCGWNEEDGKEVFHMASTPPSDSGGSFTYDFCTTSVEVTTTDDSEPSTPTRSGRIRSRQASVSSLKFDSLRLNTSPYSRPKKLSRLPSVRNSANLPKNQSSWWNDIREGIMIEDANEPVQAEAAVEISANIESQEDFWNDVEF